MVENSFIKLYYQDVRQKDFVILSNINLRNKGLLYVVNIHVSIAYL